MNRAKASWLRAVREAYPEDYPPIAQSPIEVFRLSDTEREVALQDETGATRFALVDDDKGWAEPLAEFVFNSTVAVKTNPFLALYQRKGGAS